ncbi:hypothetical protein VSR01_09945 [Actinacidiphila sp. DG2A-62]|uniref:hypothetical protein n=1 Tax=Actinacidiphila sp. DG2A-62 TaxID=3108821 RepID=UPI002DB6A036|nr:hypothetical protein [Actinacidiphila sp. DG2A-62]MEC3993845.1 hypothetical protein [Actinacidiphila sp. DG2A-62]
MAPAPPYGNLIATRFERLEHGVRIEVHDTADTRPEPRRASAEEESGRGLELVEARAGAVRPHLGRLDHQR